LKQTLMQHLAAAGHVIADFGCYDENSVDFTDVAIPLSEAVVGDEEDLGILICSNGVGMTVCANKIKGIRAALCHDTFAARRARQHTNANVLCLGAWCIGEGVVRDVVDAFLAGEFAGGRARPASGEAPSAKARWEDRRRREERLHRQPTGCCAPPLSTATPAHRGRAASRLRRPRPHTLRPLAPIPLAGRTAKAGHEARHGKLLRPLLCLAIAELSAATLRLRCRWPQRVELTANLSLIHDDIEDPQPVRHGRDAVWRASGVLQAVNAGDGMFALARRPVASSRQVSMPPRRWPQPLA
jgi:ribose 5-phosphate isomerase B